MTDCQKIVEYLEQNPNKGLTQREAGNILGIERLGARIYDLRDKGYVIECRDEPNIKKHGKHGRYFLVEKPA